MPIEKDIAKTGPQTWRTLQEINNMSFEDIASESYKPFSLTQKQRNLRNALSFDYNEDYTDVIRNTDWGNSKYDSGILTREDLLPENIQENRAQNQSGWEQLANGILKGAITTGTTMVNTLAGLPFGMLEAAANGDISKIWDNEITNTMSNIDEWAERELPNYYTREELDSPWYTNIFTANFLGDKLIKNFGFTLGAGAAGKIISKVPKLLPKIATKAATLAGRTEKDVAAIGRAANSFGTSFISAVGEGSIEALNATKEWSAAMTNQINQEQAVKLQALQQEYQAGLNSIMQTYGNTELGQQMAMNYQLEMQQRANAIENEANQKIAQVASQRAQTGNIVLAFNLPILTMGNLMTLGKVFAKGYTAEMSSIDRHILSHPEDLADVGKTVTIKNILGKPKEVVKQAFTSNVSVGKNVAKTAGNALWEGTEEMLQAWASNTSKSYNTDYYKQSVDPEYTDKTASMWKSLGDSFVDTFGNIDNWEEFAIGMLSGGISNMILGQTGEMRRERLAVNKAVDDLNNAVNTFSNREMIKGINRHQYLEDLKTHAAVEGREKEYKDADFAQLASDVVLFGSLGKLDELKAIVDYNLENLSDDELEQLSEDLSQKSENGPENNYFVKLDTKGKRQYLKDQQQKYHQVIDDYNNEYGELTALTGNLFSQEQMSELVYERLRTKNSSKRAEEIKQDLKNQINQALEQHTSDQAYHTRRLDLHKNILSGMRNQLTKWNRELIDLRKQEEVLRRRIGTVREASSKKDEIKEKLESTYEQLYIADAGKSKRTKSRRQKQLAEKISRLENQIEKYSKILNEYEENVGSKQRTRLDNLGKIYFEQIDTTTKTSNLRGRAREEQAQIKLLQKLLKIDDTNIEGYNTALEFIATNLDTIFDINSKKLYAGNVREAFMSTLGLGIMLRSITSDSVESQKMMTNVTDITTLLADALNYNNRIYDFLQNPQKLDEKNNGIKERAIRKINKKKAERVAARLRESNTFIQFRNIISSLEPKVREEALNILKEEGNILAKEFVEKDNIDRRVVDFVNNSDADINTKQIVLDIFKNALNVLPVKSLLDIDNPLYSLQNNPNITAEQYPEVLQLLSEALNYAQTENNTSESKTNIASDKDTEDVTSTESGDDENTADFIAEEDKNLTDEEILQKKKQHLNDLMDDIDDEPIEASAQDDPADDSDQDLNPIVAEESTNEEDNEGEFTAEVDTEEEDEGEFVAEPESEEEEYEAVVENEDYTPLDTDEENSSSSNNPLHPIDTKNEDGDTNIINPEGNVEKETPKEDKTISSDGFAMGVQEFDTSKNSNARWQRVIDQKDENGNPTQLAKNYKVLYDYLNGELKAFKNVDNGLIQKGDKVRFGIYPKMDREIEKASTNPDYKSFTILVFAERDGKKYCIGHIKGNRELIDRLQEEFADKLNTDEILYSKWGTVVDELWAGHVLTGNTTRPVTQADLASIRVRMANGDRTQVPPIAIAMSDNSFMVAKTKLATTGVSGNVSEIFDDVFYKGSPVILLPTGAYDNTKARSAQSNQKAYVPHGLQRLRAKNLREDTTTNRQIDNVINSLFRANLTRKELSSLIGELKKLIVLDYTLPDGSFLTFHFEAATAVRDDNGNIVGYSELSAGNPYWKNHDMSIDDAQVLVLKVQPTITVETTKGNYISNKQEPLYIRLHNGTVLESTTLEQSDINKNAAELKSFLVDEWNAFINIQKSKLVNPEYVEQIINDGLLLTNAKELRTVSNSYLLNPVVTEVDKNLPSVKEKHEQLVEDNVKTETATPNIERNNRVRGNIGRKNVKFRVNKGQRVIYRRANIEEEINRVMSMLPQLNRDEVFQIVNDTKTFLGKGPEYFGKFESTKIILSNLAEVGTTYHEAYHLIFDTILSEEEKNELLQEYKQFMPKASRYEIEEAMAENFREYCLLQDNSTFGKKILNWFRRLYNLIFRYQQNKPIFDSVAKKIWQGEYANRPISKVAGNTEEEYIDYLFDATERDKKEYEARLNRLPNKWNDNQSSDKNLLEKFNGKQTTTVNEILSKIETPNLKGFADILRENLGTIGDIEVSLISSREMNQRWGNYAGMYSYTDNHIYINAQSQFKSKNGSADNTILHEIVHAIVYNSKKDAEQVNEINEIYKEVKKLFTDTYGKDLENYGLTLNENIRIAQKAALQYALKNPDEFVSELFTNGVLIKEINKLSEPDTNTNMNLFDRIVNWIISFINTPSTLYIKAAKTVQDLLLNSQNVRVYRKGLTETIIEQNQPKQDSITWENYTAKTRQGNFWVGDLSVERFQNLIDSQVNNITSKITERNNLWSIIKDNWERLGVKINGSKINGRYIVKSVSVDSNSNAAYYNEKYKQVMAPANTDDIFDINKKCGY